MNKLASLLLAAWTVSAFAQNLLPDPGCEMTYEKNGATHLKNADTVLPGKSEGRGGADLQVFHTGKSAAFLVKTNSDGWSGIQFITPGFKPETESREVEVSLWIKAQDCRQGAIVLTGASAKKHQALWVQLGSFKDSFDWKEFRFTATVPPGVQKLTLSLRLERGPGQFWADDLGIVWKKTEKPLLFNNGFEAESDKNTGIPDGWEKREFEGWETNADISVESPGASGRKAVRLTWKSGGTKAGLQSPPLRPGAVRQYSLESRFKSDAGCPGGFLVEFFDRAGKPVGSAASPPFESTKWRTEKFSFNVPEKTDFFRVVLLLQGNGSVWYDDVKILPSSAVAEDGFPLKAKCVSVDASLIWNHGKPVFNTFADSPVQLTFNFQGDKKELKDPALILEIPEELSIPQCFETHTDLWKAVQPEVKEVLRDGRKYRQYRFSRTAVWSQIQPKYAWLRSLTMALTPRSPDAVGKTFRAYWHLENNHKSNAEQSFEVTVLPPLGQMPLPADFKGGFWNSHSMDFPDRELFLQSALKYERSNMTGRQRASRRGEYDNLLKSRGWILASTAWTADYGFQGHAPSGYFLVPGHEKVTGKMRGRMMSDGQVQMHKLCPEYFLKDADYTAFAEKAAKARLDAAGYQPGEIVFLDSEPWGTLTWCFDEPCRKAFAEFAKLPHTPTTEEILKKYSDEWVRFRTEQSTKTIRKLTELVRKACPSAVIVDYDYPLPFGSPSFAAHFRGCAKDSSRNEASIDGHLSSYYHTLGTKEFDMIRVNRRHLKKPYYVILAIEDASSYLNQKEVLSPRQFRLHVTAAAALGAKGAWVYSNAGSESDGLYFLETQKGMSEVARLEPFFRTKELEGVLRVTAEGKDDLSSLPIRHTVHRNGKDVLISLFNYDPQKEFSVQIAPVAGKILSAMNPLTEKTLTGWKGNTVPCRIPPESAVYVQLKLQE